MKKIHLTLFTLVLMLFVSSVSEAKPPIARVKARTALLRTNRVILVARGALRKNKVFTGHFRRAVMHQRMARRRFRRGRYLKALAHTRYARRLARTCIQKNRGVMPKTADMTAEEEKMLEGAPSDDQLDKDLEKELPGDVKEEDLVNMEDLDIGVE